MTAWAQALIFGLSIASTAILARLLSPQDFGLVAIVGTVTGFLRVFRDGGLSTATVQREGITHTQVSNLFWINLALSAVLTLVVASLAPIVSWFFRDSRLAAITAILSLTFLVSGATFQHQALLSRQMRFGALALIDVGSIAASVAVSVAMATMGYGYWSLVGASISLEIVRLLLTWTTSSWRPLWPGRDSGTSSLVRFGANLTVGNFIFFLGRGMDTVLLGRYLGAEPVGLYSRGMALLIRPLEQLIAPLSSVFVPVLSRLQSDPERYRRAFLQVYESVALIGFLFTALLLALSTPITLFLLGPKWEAAAAVFAGFTIAGIYSPLAAVASWLYTSQGRGRDLLVSNSILSVLTVMSFIVGLPFGPAGVAIAFSVSGCLVRLPVLYYLCGRQGPVSSSELWIGFFRHLPLWFVVVGVTLLARSVVDHLSPFAQLIICAPLGLSAGTLFIASVSSHRRVAAKLLQTLRGAGSL